MSDFKQTNLKVQDNSPTTRQQVDQFLYNFSGQGKQQRGPDWQLSGGGAMTNTFLASTVNYSIAPSANNTYSLGTNSLKWANVWTTLLNGVTPKAGNNTYYVAASSGGAVTTAITFSTGILT